MRSRILQLFFAGVSSVAFCAATIGVAAQSTPNRSLLALSKHNHTLAIVDPNTLQVVARAPVGPDPHEVIASSDGKTAYVSIYGGGRYHALSVIDLVGQKALPDIDTGALDGSHGLTFVGRKLWFTAEGAKVVATYDPESGKIDWVMGTGQDRTHMIYVTPDQKQIYTTNVSSGTVSILEKVTLPPMGPPPGMRPPQGVTTASASARRKSTAHGLERDRHLRSAKAMKALTYRQMDASYGPRMRRTAHCL